MRKIDYEFPFLRVKAITLPGDFSTIPNTISVIQRYDTNYANVLVPSTGWGMVTDTVDNARFIFNANQMHCNTKEYFNTDITYPTHTGDYDNMAAIRFDYDKLGYFAGIDSAMLYIAPFRNFLYLNNRKYLTGFVHDVYGIGARYGVTYENCGNNTNNVEKYGIAESTVGTPVNIIAFDSTLNCHAFYPQKHDIKTTLNSMRNASQNTLWGIFFKPRITEIGMNETFPQRFFLHFTHCGGSTTFDPVEWTSYYAPKLNIYGRYMTVDTVKTPVINGGTYVYYYDDKYNTVSVHSKFSHTPIKTKQVRYHFDGFGNIKEKDVFTGTEAFDDFNFKFNFMNQPAENIDARGNSTKFTYDYAGRQIKTTNADNTFSTTAFAYDDELENYFGTSGPDFVERQQFTDENNRIFYKYFDAVGNLLREEKFAAGDGNGNPVFEDNPYDPDTTYEMQDFPSNMAALTTDYKYDNLYRLVQVKTPQGKNIYYNYDGYGRQSRRVTPDAGITTYSYDNNGNLIHSQDENQRAVDAGLNTKRTYDGLNRLLTISDMKFQGTPSETGPMGDTLLPLEMDSPPNADSVYVVNVYDTISTAVLGIFNTLPADYSSAPNYTRGNLAATAYRTLLGDAWGFKFYRYDERGNVTKLWHFIAGLGWKSEVYYHNSQNQLTRNWYQPNQADGKLFTYGYDDAGRLDYVNQYVGATPEDPEQGTDASWAYFTLAKYKYNQNSQIDTLKTNDNTNIIRHTYDNRNRLTLMYKATNLIFGFEMGYNANGNIRQHRLMGNYSANFPATGEITYKYMYDNSNRLLKAECDSGISTTRFDLINGYDKDGNLTNMKRYGSTNNLADNFSYSYFSGTNKLRGIDGPSGRDQYTYDANGNITKDDNNRNHSVKYDHRNLMTEIRSIKTESSSSPFDPGPVDVLYITLFKYDEAGNRIRKTVKKYQGSNPTPIYEETGDNPGWNPVSDEFYVRDVSGKEVAVYSSSNLQFWNIWGLDNVGKINADTTRNYYLKDHLGSIRVVLNSSNGIISAQDYDAWGYPLENRTYNATAMKYDFTGKERDDQTTYDYFGARYYDSRIGRWSGVEPLLDKFIEMTPYCYSQNNSVNRLDVDGKDDYYYQKANEVGIVKTNSDVHNYFVQNDAGNIEHNGSSYFKANSQQTVDLYDWSNVDTKFESGKFVDAFSYAAPKWDFITKMLMRDTYVGFNSLKGGALDQKSHVLINESTLYLFNNVLYNKNEAGNIVWGAVMSYFYYSLSETKALANSAAVAIEHRLDEKEEQRAIEVGYIYYKNNSQKLDNAVNAK
jgi:RHS repeat-associated protein